MNDMFTGYTVAPSMIINTPVTTLPSKTVETVRKSLGVILNNNITIDLAYDLYSRLAGLINANDRIKMVTCAWIANKMVEKNNMSLHLIPFDLHEILQMERSICDYLSYRLYCKSIKVSFKEKE